MTHKLNQQVWHGKGVMVDPTRLANVLSADYRVITVTWLDRDGSKLSRYFHNPRHARQWARQVRQLGASQITVTFS